MNSFIHFLDLFLCAQHICIHVLFHSLGHSYFHFPSFFMFLVISCHSLLILWPFHDFQNQYFLMLCQALSQFSSCCEPAVLCSSWERWLSVRLLFPMDQSGPPAVCLVKPVSQSGSESVCHNACHLVLTSRSIRRTPVHLNPTTCVDRVEHFSYKTI